MGRSAAIAAALLFSAALAACAAPSVDAAGVARVAPAPRPQDGPAGGPPAAWDHHARGTIWTAAALDALDDHAAPLVAMVPADVTDWCPAYPAAGRERRKAFWVALVSAMSGMESGWRPAVSNPTNRWHGLMQISPETARGHGCRATTAEALKSGPANLRCGLRIITRTVTRDAVVARGGGGVAADWGPFSRPAQREKLRAFTRTHPACRA